MKTKILSLVLGIAFVAGTLAGCADKIDVSDADQPQRLVVYSLPTPADTNYVQVRLTQRMENFGYGQVAMATPEHVSISYQVNGKALTVERIKDSMYKVIGTVKAGDKVDIRVEAPGVDPVQASTVVPQPATLSDAKVEVRKHYYSDGSKSKPMNQISFTFDDPKETNDYYAVTIQELRYHGEGVAFRQASKDTLTFRTWEEMLKLGIDQTWDSIRVYPYNYVQITYPRVDFSYDIVLPHTSDLDESFGYSNNFYDDLYIFDDKAINGKRHTLRLNVKDDTEGALSAVYVVKFMRLSADYYRFLQTVNNTNNSDLPDMGLATITPTYTNLNGGFGLVGGWSTSEENEIETIEFLKEVAKWPNIKFVDRIKLPFDDTDTP